MTCECQAMAEMAAIIVLERLVWMMAAATDALIICDCKNLCISLEALADDAAAGLATPPLGGSPTAAASMNLDTTLQDILEDGVCRQKGWFQAAIAVGGNLNIPIIQELDAATDIQPLHQLVSAYAYDLRAQLASTSFGLAVSDGPTPRLEDVEMRGAWAIKLLDRFGGTDAAF